MTSSTMITIAVPLTKADRQLAQAFKDQQPIAEKADQLYRNTLAVLATHHYLEMLDIATDLAKSHSQDPAQFLNADIADLYLPQLNSRLECRAVLPGEDSCQIPEAVRKRESDRMGYVVVRLNQTNTEATILGFFPEVTAEIIPLTNLQSLDDLLETIAATFESNAMDQQISSNLLHLREMLDRQYRGESTYGSEWSLTERLPSTAMRSSDLSPPVSLPSVRSASWATLLKLGSLIDRAIILVVQITAKLPEHDLFDISFIFSSGSDTDPLPSGLEVTIANSITQEIYHSRIKPEAFDYRLDLPLLNCQARERFKVEATLDNMSITKEFEV